MRNKNATTSLWGKFFLYKSDDYLSLGFIHGGINYVLFSWKRNSPDYYLKVPKPPFIVPYLNMDRRETNSQRFFTE